MDNIETESQLLRLQALYEYVKNDMIDDYIWFLSNDKTIKYVLNDNDLFDKTEKYSNVLWLVLEKSMTLEQVISDIYNNYCGTNVITTRFNKFNIRVYSYFLMNTLNKRNSLLISLLEKQGIPNEITEMHIIDKCKIDYLSLLLLPINKLLHPT